MRQLLISLLLLVVLSTTNANKLIIDAEILSAATGTSSNDALTSLIAGFNQNTVTQIGGLPILSITINGSTPSTTGSSPTTASTSSAPSTSSTSGTSSSNPGSSTTSSSSVVTSSWALLLITLTSLLSSQLSIQSFGISRKSLIVLFFLYLISSSYALTGYANCKLLNDELNYKLYWTVNTAENAIYIGQEATLANGLGWLGFGISPNGRMNGGGDPNYSDIIHGYPGCTNMSDMSTNVYNTPILDASQNVVLIKQGKTGNTVSFEWKRALNTGDVASDHIIDPTQSTSTIWAANNGAQPTGPTSFAFHTHKSSYGGEAITFSNSYTCPGQGGDAAFTITVTGRLATFNQPQFVDALATQLGVTSARIVIKNITEIEDVFCPECEVVDLIFPDYTVPAQPTTYVFRGFDLPPGPPKHIVRFESIKDNVQVLHHIVLYLDPTGNALNNTYAYNQPAQSKPIFAWAPGADRFDLPADVGFLVRSDATNKHVVVNMHYNNPTSIPNLRDSSGIRIYLNATRPNNAGFMWLGVGVSFPANTTSTPPLPANALPMGYSDLHYTSACPDVVTYSALTTAKKMNIFAYFNHMHLYGRIMWTDWIRTAIPSLKKTYIGKLGEILNYRFDEQKFVALDTPQILQGGDALVTHCIFDTTTAPSNVVGGEATNNEMCLQGIMYYPDYGFAGCATNQTGYGECPYPCNQTTTPWL